MRGGDGLRWLDEVPVRLLHHAWWGWAAADAVIMETIVGDITLCQISALRSLSFFASSSHMAQPCSKYQSNVAWYEKTASQP